MPLPASLVFELYALLAETPDVPDELVFQSLRGTPLNPDNIRSRVLKPVFEEVGAPWAGFHSRRHTFASMQLARGTNILQLSRALATTRPSFTLERYCHLLDDDLAPPLDPDADLSHALVVQVHPAAAA